jgi:hypothetical protein
VEWLGVHFPDRKEKVLGRLRELRGGKLNDPNFGSRMQGEGSLRSSWPRCFGTARKSSGLIRKSST